MVISVYGVLVLLLASLMSRSDVISLQTLLLVLGGTTALTLTAAGGATIVVPVLCLPFMVLAAVVEASRSGAFGRASHATFWLGVTAIWGTLLAIAAPRLLPPSIMVMALSRANEDGNTYLLPLAPVSGNFTQSVYALGAVASFSSARFLMRRRDRVLAFRNAAITLALVNCGLGALNLIEFYLHIPSILDYARTAYAVTHQEFLGMPRIQGTFPETSSYSSFSLMLFGFTSSLWLDGVRTKLTGIACGLLFLFLMLSTSGTAYAGLTLYVGIYVMLLLRRLMKKQRVPRLATLVSLLMFALLVVGALIAWVPAVVNAVSAFLEVATVGKLDSGSGMERGSWNTQGLSNFSDSFGLGLGWGTVRTSSFLVTLLSNAGAIGTLTYCLFLFHVFAPKSSPSAVVDASTSRACRQAVIATLCAATVSATVFDLGVGFYMFAAVASLPAARQRAAVRSAYVPLQLAELQTADST